MNEDMPKLNREVRRKVQKKAEKIWKLEKALEQNPEDKDSMKELIKLSQALDPEELLLIDVYITEKYGNAN